MQIYIVLTWRKYTEDDGSTKQVWWDEFAVIANNKEEAITKTRQIIQKGRTTSTLTDDCTAEELTDPAKYHDITIIP